MPEIDGFRFTERLKSDPALAGTPVIMLISGDHPEDIARCRELGVAGCLLKPIKPSELLATIRHALAPCSAIASPAQAEPRRPGPLTILVAEDSIVNQKLVAALLQREGHTVSVVETGRKAIAAVRSQRFDLVLMDVHMPEMGGLEAAAAIRALETSGTRHLPIIAMTACAFKDDRERCLSGGMDGYVSKPIRAAELRSTMQDVLAAALAAR